MISRDLCNDNWTVRPVGDLSGVPDSVRAAPIPARVPGCVHTDLMRAGLIGDPRVGMNELGLQWIGETDWEYRAAFEFSESRLEHERLDLVCEGLDTIAELTLNGNRIGTAANMFHPHRFDVRAAARTGANELAITFRSPLKQVRAEAARLGPRPSNGDALGWEPYNFIRKSACNFGWDWAPKVATSGVSGTIKIERWNIVRISGVRPAMRREGDRWTVDVNLDLGWSGAGQKAKVLRAEARLSGPGGIDLRTACDVKLGQPQAALRFELDGPRLWWPTGLGGQDRYSVEVALRAHGEPHGVADARAFEIGLRETRLNTERDGVGGDGSRFQLEVNGKPVFCKGANWIPEGLFPDDRSPEKIRERVRQAAAANMNMLRVWGGGLYESDEFYDECDRQGIMVWQDFMFACACYPEEPPFPALIEAEARHQIARLSKHPSVVLWCGGNECVQGYECWGNAPTDVGGPWKQRLGDRAWGRGYWLEMLPRLLRELDPMRPYWPNSPFSGREGEHPNQETRGDRHTWDASPGSRAFRTIVPRFCAEFGHQAPASIETLRAVFTPENLAVGSAALQHRERGTGGIERHIDEPLRAALAHHPHLAKGHDVSTFEGWHALAQMAQAGSLKAAIEHLAASRPRCMGALIWQLNDAWPALSWSLIDSDGKPKPAYHAVQEAFGKIKP